MSAAMGVRCWDDRFSYVAVSGTPDSPVVVDARHVPFPVNLERPAQLSEFRKDVYDLLDRYKVTAVYFHGQEQTAQNKSLGRAEVEGVLQETCCSHDPSVVVRARNKVQFKMSLNFAGLAKNVMEVADRIEFKKLSKTKFAEAIVAALAALTE